MTQNETLKEQIKALLSSGLIADLYRNTFYSIKKRISDDGYFPESLTGAYEGMFCRTSGGLASLLFETENYDLIEKVLSFIIAGTISNDFERIPEVFSPKRRDTDGSLKPEVLCSDDQIDGQAHVIMAWARLALQRGETDFEDFTYSFMAKLMDRSLDQMYFYSGKLPWSNHMLNLIYNSSFEHSREERRWHAFDLLSQCFVGAAADAMVKIAEKRSDFRHAELWKMKLEKLRQGVGEFLTRVVNGKTVYLEMRLPDSDWGIPYEAMSWVNLSPVAAQWEPLGRDVLKNTVQLLREKLWLHKKDEGYSYLAREYNPDGKIIDQVIGKGVGWDLEYSRQEREYQHILDWFDFLLMSHKAKVYMECMKRDKDGSWIINDGGNGEQTCWWCWAIARLRKDVGLSAAP